MLKLAFFNKYVINNYSYYHPTSSPFFPSKLGKTFYRFPKYTLDWMSHRFQIRATKNSKESRWGKRRILRFHPFALYSVRTARRAGNRLTFDTEKYSSWIYASSGHRRPDPLIKLCRSRMSQWRPRGTPDHAVHDCVTDIRDRHLQSD